MKAGRAGGEGFAVDASVIEAAVLENWASRFQRVEGAEVDWTPEQRASRPVREYLTALESENPADQPQAKAQGDVAERSLCRLDPAGPPQGDVRL
jgi:hypothetical protein